MEIQYINIVGRYMENMKTHISDIVDFFSINIFHYKMKILRIWQLRCLGVLVSYGSPLLHTQANGCYPS